MPELSDDPLGVRLFEHARHPRELTCRDSASAVDPILGPNVRRQVGRMALLLVKLHDSARKFRRRAGSIPEVVGVDQPLDIEPRQVRFERGDTRGPVDDADVVFVASRSPDEYFDQRSLAKAMGFERRASLRDPVFVHLDGARRSLGKNGFDNRNSFAILSRPFERFRFRQRGFDVGRHLRLLRPKRCDRRHSDRRHDCKRPSANKNRHLILTPNRLLESRRLGARENFLRNAPRSVKNARRTRQRRNAPGEKRHDNMRRLPGARRALRKQIRRRQLPSHRHLLELRQAIRPKRLPCPKEIPIVAHTLKFSVLADVAVVGDRLLYKIVVASNATRSFVMG